MTTLNIHRKNLCAIIPKSFQPTLITIQYLPGVSDPERHFHRLAAGVLGVQNKQHASLLKLEQKNAAVTASGRLQQR